MKTASIATEIEVIVRVLCDTRPNQKVDAVYLFSQTRDNEESVFSKAKNMIENSVTQRILLLNTLIVSGYPGFNDWKSRLVRMGIAGDIILSVDLYDKENHNTLTEAESLIRFAREKKYESLIVTAPPFHQVRVFMTAVRVAIAEYPELKIFSISGKPLAWNETVIHSQGTLTKKRCELIGAEFERIKRYYKKGDLISYGEILDYLDERNKNI